LLRGSLGVVEVGEEVLRQQLRIAFAVARGSTPRNSETPSIVRWPGVSTSSGAPSSGGKSAAGGTPEAISRSAA